MTRYSLAKIGFSLEGSAAPLDALRREFASVVDDAATRPAHIRFRFVDALDELGSYVSLPPLKAADGVYEVDRGALAYQVRAREPGFEVSIRAASPTDAQQLIAEVIEPLLQFVYLKNDTTFVPASSFEREGRAVALVGWGAADDSAALVAQMREDGWQSLSDELAMINRNGILSPNRSHTARATKLTDLFIVERASVAAIKLRSISVADAARQSVARLLLRLPQCVRQATALHSTSYFPILARPDDLYQQSFNIIRQGFAAQNPSILALPLRTGAEELARFLRPRLRA